MLPDAAILRPGALYYPTPTGPRRTRADADRAYPPCTFRNSGTKTSETTVMSLMRMFIDGPEVSLNGSLFVAFGGGFLGR